MGGGVEAVREIIDDVEPCTVDGLYTFGSLPALPDVSWYPIDAWPNLNPHFQAMTSSVTVITGVPGHGKSKFGTHLLLELAKQYGHQIALAPFETHAGMLLDEILKWRNQTTDQGMPAADNAPSDTSSSDTGDQTAIAYNDSVPSVDNYVSTASITNTVDDGGASGVSGEIIV